MKAQEDEEGNIVGRRAEEILLVKNELSSEGSYQFEDLKRRVS